MQEVQDMSSWTVTQLREYAERVSQKGGMATVLIAVQGQVHEYVVTPEQLSRYQNAVMGALIEAARAQQQMILGELLSRGFDEVAPD